MNGTEKAQARLARLLPIAGVVGAAGILATVAGFFVAPDYIYPSYLIAFVFWNGLSVGCLGILMLHHMVGGDWGFLNRRFLESGAMTILLMAVLAVPIVLGIDHIFVWANHSLVPVADSVIRIANEKEPYLNEGFFVTRVIVYYLFWIGSAFLLYKWSGDVDQTGSSSYRTKVRLLSGPGLVIYFLLFTFYAVDFLMSLEPYWTSTIFGLFVAVGGGVSTFAFLSVMMHLMRDVEPFSRVLSPKRFQNVGTLLFAFVMLWAYMAFSQYLITWAGNLPEESEWFVKRTLHHWGIIAIVLVLFHFAIPWFLLLIRSIKKRSILLATIAVLLLLMRIVDLYWIVKPAYEGTVAEHFHWTLIAAVVGMGGLWFATMLFFMRGRAVIPVYATHHDRAPVKHEVYSHG